MTATPYLDLGLKLSTDRNGDSWVEAVGPTAERGDPVQFVLPDHDFTRKLASFHRGESSWEDAQWLGQRLFASLLSGGLRALWAWMLRNADTEAALRLRLDVRDPGLAALPWELLCHVDPASYPFVLSPLQPVIRYDSALHPPQKKAFPRPLRVLVMVAQPTDQPRFDVAGVLAEVRNALERLSPRAELSVMDDSTEPVTVSRLAAAMGQGWDVVQFIGHGAQYEGHDCLLLQNDQRTTQYVPGRDLGSVLLADPKLQLFLACACGGSRSGRVPHRLLGVAEAAFKARVPAVVGFQSPVTDRQVADFSGVFYGALADGEQLEVSVSRARQALHAGVLGGSVWAASTGPAPAPPGTFRARDHGGALNT